MTRDRRVVRCTVAAALVAASCSTVQAQSRSRVDLEVGGRLLLGESGLAVGGIAWANDNQGVAARVGYWSATGIRRPYYEVLLQFRGFVRNIEIQFGTGVVLYRYEQSGRFSRVVIEAAVKCDLLVGWRLHERFGMKVGWSSFFVPGTSEDPFYATLVPTMFVAVVPLGSR